MTPHDRLRAAAAAAAVAPLGTSGGDADDEKKRRAVALKKKLARTRSRASAFALITMKTRPEGVSYEKQQEVRKAFRKYGRIKPGEVMFDEVQALLRDMR